MCHNLVFKKYKENEVLKEDTVILLPASLLMV